jgi:hypothetical protein
MAIDVKDALTESFAQALETQAFLFVDPAEAEQCACPEKALVISMSFRGSQQGRLALGVSAAFARVLAANILGIEPEDAAAEAGGIDSAKELLNITCGSLLTSLYGETPVFDLTVPECAAVDEAGWNALLDAPGTVRLLAEEHPLLVRATLEG